MSTVFKLPDGRTVDVAKTYEVYCYHCGVVDSLPNRGKAIATAREHVTEHKDDLKHGMQPQG